MIHLGRYRRVRRERRIKPALFQTFQAVRAAEVQQYPQVKPAGVLPTPAAAVKNRAAEVSIRRAISVRGLWELIVERHANLDFFVLRRR